MGHSTFNISKRILSLKRNGITLHSVSEELVLYLQNETLFQLIYTLNYLEQSKKDKKKLATEKTRERTSTKPGRKVGKTTKSMFDPFKRKIMKLHNDGIPIKRILKEIQKEVSKQNDDTSKIQNTSEQAIGQYIKKVVQQKRKTIKREKSYIEPSKTSKKPFKSGNNLMNLDGTFSEFPSIVTYSEELQKNTENNITNIKETKTESST